MAHLWSHGCYDDASRLREEPPELGDGPLHDVDWRKQLARSDPKLRGIQPETRGAYAARRRAEGKSARDIRRCLKRVVARQLFKLLEGHDRAVVEILRA
jgi:hypothetical protein